MGSEYIIELDNVVAGYREARGFTSLFKKLHIVLRDISFKVRPGERIAIIGESGSGKTTLLRVILGLLKPVSGRVLIYGRDIYSIPPSDRKQILRRIGYVPQDPYKSLNPLLKIRDIIAEPLEAAHLPQSIIEQRIREVVSMVGLPLSVLDKIPEELSGGMRQRVLIARSIVGNPEILLLDEPTSALDVSIQAQIIELLNSIYNKFKPAMITVTHDIAVAQYLADYVIILKEGVIVESGDFDLVIKSPKSKYTRDLISSYMYLSINQKQ